MRTVAVLDFIRVVISCRGTFWGEQGFFRVERGVNALQIESGDCWYVFQKRFSRRDCRLSVELDVDYNDDVTVLRGNSVVRTISKRVSLAVDMLWTLYDVIIRVLELSC